MPTKKDDKPYMPFYIGDWMKAPEVRALRLDYRMVWFETLCIMWQSEEKGHLTINKQPFVITDDITGVITDGEQVLASMLGISCSFLQEAFAQFHKLGCYKKRADGAIYSGFMVKLVKNQEVKSKAGKKGMEARYKKSVITPVITSFEYEYDNEVLIILNKVREFINTDFDETKKDFYAMIVLKMIEVFMRHNPDYFFDKETDYTACLQIAYHIAAMKKWSKYDVVNGKMNDCLDVWQTIIHYVKNDKWFSGRSLTDLSSIKEWQRLTQQMSKTTTNAPDKHVVGKTFTPD